MMKVSIVIPCYGSENTLANVVAEIQSVCRAMECDYEIIMVCDASPDRVYEVIRGLCRKDPTHCKGIGFSRNFGQHSALMAGYRHALGDVIVSLDDDGQAPVESIPQLVDALKNADIVFGAYDEKRHNFFRNFGSKINDFMAEKLLNKPADLQVTSFFAMRRFVAEEICRYDNAYAYILGLLLRTSNEIVNVPVRHRCRAAGVSGYTFLKLLKLWINGFTAFSVVPLRIATLCGFMVSIIGFIGSIWIICNKICRPSVPIGYSSVMTVLTFLGGLLMLMLGMIGEYIGRIYICLNKSPQYVVKDKIGFDK